LHKNCFISVFMIFAMFIPWSCVLCALVQRKNQKKRCGCDYFILLSDNTSLIHSRNETNLHCIVRPFHLLWIQYATISDLFCYLTRSREIE
jgi:hypothetical protein